VDTSVRLPHPCLLIPDIDTISTGTLGVPAWAMDPAFRSRGGTPQEAENRPVVRA
jgi:hypothetical protein